VSRKPQAALPKWRVWPFAGGTSLGVVAAPSQYDAVKQARARWGDAVIVMPAFRGAEVTA
jgi:hypothetical protein